jgi:hypothetical protein
MVVPEKVYETAKKMILISRILMIVCGIVILGCIVMIFIPK